MDLKNKTVLVLGGAGLVGISVSRLILREGPSKVVIGSLLREEAESSVDLLRAEGLDESVVSGGWVDLRVSNWERWRERLVALSQELDRRPGIEAGSVSDHEYGDADGKLRPGRLASWILKGEDQGARTKR